MDVGKFIGAAVPRKRTLRALCELFQQVNLKEEVAMLKWAVTFLVIALVAAVFGFTDIAAASAGIAQILFAIFLVLFLALLVLGMAGGKSLTS